MESAVLGPRVLGGSGTDWSGHGGVWQLRNQFVGGPVWDIPSALPCHLFLFADSDDALLKMTINQQEFGHTGLPDLSSMTEEEQIAYAMQMSLQGAGEPGPGCWISGREVGMGKWN